MKANPENDNNDSGRPEITTNSTPFMTAEEYVRDRLEGQMNWYDKKSSWNQKQYRKMKRIEIILAASIPVLIGISSMKIFDIPLITLNVQQIVDGKAVFVTDEFLSLNGLLQICAAVAGVYLVLVNKFLALDMYFENWKSYRATAEQMQQERVKFLTKVDPYDENDAFPRLVDAIESILNKENSSWRERAKPKTDDIVKKATAMLDQQVAQNQEVAHERAIQRAKNPRTGVQQQAPAKKKTNTVAAPIVEEEDFVQAAYEEAVEEPDYEEAAYNDTETEGATYEEDYAREGAEVAADEGAYAEEEMIDEGNFDGGEGLDEPIDPDDEKEVG